MFLSNVASIERDVLIRALGLQKNYKETYEEDGFAIDLDKSGCYGCPFYQRKKNPDDYSPAEVQDAYSYCKTCPTVMYKRTYKKVQTPYNHAKIRLGYLSRLPKNSLKLFLLYHFLSPDRYGTLYDLNVHELAEIMNCSPQTIYNSNNKLINFGYVIEGESYYQSCLTLCLSEYHNYFVNPIEDTSSYIVLTKEILLGLMTLPVNALRLALRAYLELDYDAQSATDTGKTFSLKELQHYLPDYCHPNIIRKALEHLKDIFSVSISTYSTDIIMDSKKNPHQIIKKEKQLALNAIKHSSYLSINSSDRDREDFVRLAAEYTCQTVKKAFSYFQRHKVKTSNLGAWLNYFIHNPIPEKT